MQELGTSAENMMLTTRGLIAGRRPTRIAPVDRLADVTWRVNRTMPAASSATAATVAHGKRHAAAPQHLRGKGGRSTKPQCVADCNKEPVPCVDPRFGLANVMATDA